MLKLIAAVGATAFVVALMIGTLATSARAAPGLARANHWAAIDPIRDSEDRDDHDTSGGGGSSCTRTATGGLVCDSDTSDSGGLGLVGDAAVLAGLVVVGGVLSKILHR